jgi:ParB family chromosome partitioning protein
VRVNENLTRKSHKRKKKKLVSDLDALLSGTYLDNDSVNNEINKPIVTVSKIKPKNLETTHTVNELDRLLSLKNNQNKKTFLILHPSILVPSKYQTREDFDDDKIKALAESIKIQGIIQPLVVRPISNDKQTSEQYEIIVGERRWRAAKLAGVKKIPVLVHQVNDDVAMATNLIENIQRQNLNILEEAKAISRLISEFSMTHEEIGKFIGKSRAAITNILRLLSLEPTVKAMLINDEVSAGHARALLALKDEQQIEIAKKIAQQSLTVREVERLVAKLSNFSPPSTQLNQEIKSKTEIFSKQLEGYLSTKVKINANNQWQGRAVIYFESEEELKWLVDKIDSE